MGLGTDEAGDWFGASLVVGNWDGDARQDLAVGAPDDHISSIPSGRVYTYLGNASSMLVAWTAVDQAVMGVNEEEDMFGRRLAAGNFDRDTKDDLVVAAPGEAPGSSARSGAAHVFKGGTSGLTAQVTLDQATLQTNDTQDAFGERLAVGDWNNDGKKDIVAIAPGMPSGTKSDALYLYKGSATGPLAWKTLAWPP